MQATHRDERPPFVTFEMMPVEDREASIQAGMRVTKDVPTAFITPHGSKDRIPRVIPDWFHSLQQQVEEGRYPAAWLEQHRRSFDFWRQGQVAPVNGIALATWPHISPGQVANARQVGIVTVEDLANCNDEAIRRIGMGAVALREQAKLQLQSAASGTAALVQEVTDLREERESMLELLNQMRAEIDELKNAADRGEKVAAQTAANPFKKNVADDQLAELDKQITADVKGNS